MHAIDPRTLHVDASTPPPWAVEVTFDDIMAEQLRHAPWIGVSVLLHAVALALLLLMPSENRLVETRTVQMQAPELVEDIVEETPPDPEPLIDPVVEPQLQDVELPPTEDVATDDFEQLAETASTESAFDHDQWNPALGLGGGASGPHGARGSGREILTRSGGKATAVVIDNALRWLARHQDDDGRWDADEFMKHDGAAPCDGPGNPVHDVGVTGLALLAFLGDGSTLNQGPYREVVKRATAWLRDQQDPDTGLVGTRSSNEFVYDHAIAALALVEACGLSNSRILRPNAQKAIDYLEYHRNPYLAWRYQPRDGDNDTSVTGWCVMAYESARHFGLEVNTAALKLAETWFDQMTDPVTARTGYVERGGFSSRRAGDHAVHFPRENGECMTSVSLLCRFFLGKDPQTDPMMTRQADLILRKKPVWNEQDGSIDQYAWYYATYALYQMGGRHWREWERALTDAVVRTQRQDGSFDGSWDPIGVWGDDGGRVYSTALLCLTLEAYYRYTRLVR